MGSDAHIDRAQQVRDELTCPQCDYSLRGLAGDVVLCPECGHQCNITAMMTRQWRGPWQRAPGFGRLVWPLAWLVAATIVGFVVYAWEQSQGGSGLATMAWSVVVVIGWAVLLHQVRHVPTPGAGVPLALLAHVLFAGYILGIVMVMVLLARALNAIGMTVRVVSLVLLAVPIAVFVLMRAGEKHIAQRCIRAWLNRPTEE